jgi:hypothetical protein
MSAGRPEGTLGQSEHGMRGWAPWDTARREGVINCLADCLRLISPWFWMALTWNEIPVPARRTRGKLATRRSSNTETEMTLLLSMWHKKLTEECARFDHSFLHAPLLEGPAYGLDDRGSILGRRRAFSLFSTVSRPALWPTLTSIQWVPGVKQPKREDEHSPLTSTEFKNAQCYTSTLP